MSRHPTVMYRPEPSDCQHEPPYPAHETVMVALCDPSLVVHADHDRQCRRQGPHPWKDCGHVNGACWDCGKVPTDEKDRQTVELGFNCQACFDRGTAELREFCRRASRRASATP
ncbi:hypothetical protein LCGC14_2082490 [marine sediment metagenome]|uniref:Uncharacterized protein n=1 Tax=marine sediment metagenome TaxID=412755 RepID=A0A0F9EFD7_9ZZZZ